MAWRFLRKQWYSASSLTQNGIYNKASSMLHKIMCKDGNKRPPSREATSNTGHSGCTPSSVDTEMILKRIQRSPKQLVVTDRKTLEVLDNCRLPQLARITPIIELTQVSCADHLSTITTSSSEHLSKLWAKSNRRLITQQRFSKIWICFSWSESWLDPGQTCHT